MVTARSKHIPSILLTDEENAVVFQVLGQKQYSKATTVAEVHMALPTNRTQWVKQHMGVVCLVKDGALKSYFIRLIDIKQKAIAWEQELYKQFKYKQATSTFHTFNGDENRVGLNFCNEQEAQAFRAAVKERIREFRRKREEFRLKRLKQQQMMMVMSGGLIPHPSGRGFIRIQNMPGVGAQASRGNIQMAGPRGPPMIGKQMSMMRPHMSGVMPQMSGMLRPGRAGGIRPSMSMMRHGPPFPRRPMKPGMRGLPPPNWGPPGMGPPPRYHPRELQPGQYPSGQFPRGSTPMGHPAMGSQGSGQFYPGKGPAHTGMTLANSQAPMQQEPNGMHRPSTPKHVKAEEEKLKNEEQQDNDEKKKKKGFFSMFRKEKPDVLDHESKLGEETSTETTMEERVQDGSVPVSIESEFVGGDMIVGVDESGEIYTAVECQNLLEGITAGEIFQADIEIESTAQAFPENPASTTAESSPETTAFAPPPPPPPPPLPPPEILFGSDIGVPSPRPSVGLQSGGLMESIVAGKQLKKVDRSNTAPPPPSNEMTGMGGALARALDERSKVMHSSDEEDYEDDEDWDDDDDDDWSD